jgi:hypothetical protein
MKELYIELKVDNFKEIQEELRQAIPQYTIEGFPKAIWNTYDSVIEKCPKVKEFFADRCIVPFDEIKWYITPPGMKLPIHKDGTALRLGYEFHNFGINMPVLGVEGTTHDYWTTEHENILFPGTISESERQHGYKGGTVDRVIDPNKAVLVDSLELRTPTIINTSQFHSVTNPTDHTRIVIAFRWSIKRQSKDPSDYIRFDDIRM